MNESGWRTISEFQLRSDVEFAFNREKMTQVRYIVDDVEDAIAFYVSKLGFELEQQYGPAFAIVVHGDLTLWLAGPKASASKPMPDGAIPRLFSM